MTEKNDKFILMNMDDKRLKKIAEAMGNPTCKKILDHLTYNSEKSEEDISKALNMNLNTIEYNLNKLIAAGLVVKTKKFFWSKRGKKIPTYNIAKKHIVISPKSTRPNMNVLKITLPIIIAIAVVVALIALMLPSGTNTTTPNTDDTFSIKKFSSMSELEEYLEENIQNQEYYGTRSDSLEIAPEVSVGASTGASADSSSKASDYSETNIQVQGVDEPDIVKNDGKYIYVSSGNKIIIVDAYPAENMEIISEIEITNPRDIFVNQDKLIIFSTEYKSESKSMIFIYDITDKTNPQLEKEIAVDGDYVNARMIGNNIYLIANQYIRTTNPILPMFEVNGIERQIAVTDIAYFPNYDSNYVFTNIIALDLETGENTLETYLTGSSYTIYASKDNIYLTSTKRISSQDYFEEAIEEVFMSILPSNEKSKVKKIMDSDEPYYKKQQEVSKIIEDYSNSLKGSEKSNFDKELLEKTQDFEIQLSKKLEKTIIHKININNLDIEYFGNGEVPGRILNQFSMDEYNGNFRIATTTGDTWGNSNSLNHMYVLNEDLKIIGSVDDLAKGERIYSTRFMGERAYMVTFRQVDPLFVVDLSTPENPKVLGELKVTGFSSYLHPYDENHIIGIGKEATEEGRTTGVKIALFDVSDPSNPIEKAKYELGHKYSDSIALYDHKAFLFDKERNLLVLPVSFTEVSSNVDTIEVKEEYRQGAYVFTITENHINLNTFIDHKEESDEEGYYYGPYAVQRSLYMDNFLYTISGTMIKANDLSSFKEISKVYLPYELPPPLFRGEPGIMVDSTI